MAINNINLRYLEHYYLPRIVNQYQMQIGERDPVSNAANAAIISGISATVTNIFQFIIPQGIPKITIGTPSFRFLTQNLTLGAFSIALGVFALGRLKQSINLAEAFSEENTVVLANSQKWETLLKKSLAEDILEIAQLQSSIDAKNLEFIKANFVCFILSIGLITINAILSTLSLEMLAMATIYAMIGILIVLAYNLGSHWDDNIINRKRIEALHVNDIITKLHKVNSPQETRRNSETKKFKLSIDGENVTIPICPMKSNSVIPHYRIIAEA
ncbi:MAG: hypothetical protein ACRCSV_00525 [Chlamydiales bacterium]